MKWKKESCAIWKWIIEAVKNLAIDLHFWQFQIKAKWLDPAFGKEKRRCQWNWTWDIALKSMMILYMYFKNILYFLQLSINELRVILATIIAVNPNPILGFLQGLNWYIPLIWDTMAVVKNSANAQRQL